jgi:hypothetical protein
MLPPPTPRWRMPRPGRGWPPRSRRRRGRPRPHSAIPEGEAFEGHGALCAVEDQLRANQPPEVAATPRALAAGHDRDRGRPIGPPDGRAERDHAKRARVGSARYARNPPTSPPLLTRHARPPAALSPGISRSLGPFPPLMGPGFRRGDNREAEKLGPRADKRRPKPKCASAA